MAVETTEDEVQFVLLLLDEPLSNVDQSFKEEIQIRLKRILKKQQQQP